MLKGRNSKKVQYIEMVLQNYIAKEFYKTALEISKLVKKQEKSLEKTIENIIKLGNNKIVNKIVEKGTAVFGMGVDAVKKEKNKNSENKTELEDDGINVNIDVNWELLNENATKYFDGLEQLYKSQKDGSILKTSITGVNDIIKSGLIEGQSYTKIAENILGSVDAGVFSRSRAEMIAVREMGMSYETGSKQSEDQFNKDINAKYKEIGVDKIVKTIKKWLTVGDNRVTKTHTQNAGDGFIGLNESFSGTGDSIPPASDNPRCRCTIGYDYIIQK